MRFGLDTGDAAEYDSIRRRLLIFTLLVLALALAGAMGVLRGAGATEGSDEFCENEIEAGFFFDYYEDCNNFEFEDTIWKAVFDCPTCDFAEIDIHTPTGGDIADIEISQSPSDAPFTLIVTFDKGEGPPSGLARVDKDGEDMDRCRGNHDEDCVKVIRISGARTQYTVKVDEDPRFKFR